MHWTSWNPGLRISAALLVLLSVTACGGGDSGDTTAPPPPADVPAPVVLANVITFPADVAGSGLSSQSNSLAIVEVTNATTDAPVVGAAVTVNGVALSYDSVEKDYEGELNIAAGALVTVRVTVSGKVFSTSMQQFAESPVVTNPASGGIWSNRVPNELLWSPGSARPESQYLVGILDGDGNLLWPSGGALRVLDRFQSRDVVPEQAVSVGSRLALVGLTEARSWVDAAPGSGLLLTSFGAAPFTVTNLSLTVSWVGFGQTHTAVELGKPPVTVPLVATYDDGHTEDVSALSTWSSSDTAKIAVGSSGQLTGVTRGRANVQATYAGTTYDISVFAFQPTSSPPPPLSHSVGYQGDYAHSGYVTFGGTALSFPPAATWTATLDARASYPLVAEGKVFVLSDAKSLYAYDLATGNLAWGPVAVAGAFNRGTAYDQGRIFVTTSDDTLRSYDAASGTLRWSAQLPGSEVLATPPMAVNGVVYVSGSYSVFAVDELDGELLWVHGGEGGSPSASADGIFVAKGCLQQKLHPIQGTVLWRNLPPCSGGGLYTAPVALGGLHVRDVYAASGAVPQNIFDAATGISRPGFGAATIPALSPAGFGYVQTYSAVTAVDFPYPTFIRWSFTGDGTGITAPFVIDNTVFVGGTSGMVYAVNASSGQMLWSDTAGAPIEPGVIEGRGFGAGEGWLVVVASNTLRAWKVVP